MIVARQIQGRGRVEVRISRTFLIASSGLQMIAASAGGAASTTDVQANNARTRRQRLDDFRADIGAPSLTGVGAALATKRLSRRSGRLRQARIRLRKDLCLAKPQQCETTQRHSSVNGYFRLAARRMSAASLSASRIE